MLGGDWRQDEMRWSCCDGATSLLPPDENVRLLTVQQSHSLEEAEAGCSSTCLVSVHLSSPPASHHNTAHEPLLLLLGV